MDQKSDTWLHSSIVCSSSFFFWYMLMQNIFHFLYFNSLMHREKRLVCLFCYSKASFELLITLFYYLESKKRHEIIILAHDCEVN